MPDFELPPELDPGMDVIGSDGSGVRSRSSGGKRSGNLSSDAEPLPPGAALKALPKSAASGA